MLAQIFFHNGLYTSVVATAPTAVYKHYPSYGCNQSKRMKVTDLGAVEIKGTTGTLYLVETTSTYDFGADSVSSRYEFLLGSE